MNFRIFSKSHNLYTNDPAWPSNQRTTSEFVLRPNGEIVELIDDGACGISAETLDSRNYIVEPWTGYFDSKGKKIYRGDLLMCENDSTYLSEVVWKEDGFVCMSTKDPKDEMPLHLDVKVWKWVIVCGNIHGAEYSD